MNVREKATKGRKAMENHSRMALTVGEMEELYNIGTGNDTIFDLIQTAFYVGANAGYKARTAEEKTR